jgi:hypothetical protein
VITHGACGKTWKSGWVCQCGKCHEHFQGVNAFDLHWLNDHQGGEAAGLELRANRDGDLAWHAEARYLAQQKRSETESLSSPGGCP